MLQKVKCLGDVLDSVSLPPFAALKSQFLDVFILKFRSDLDLAQYFLCSVRTVECGALMGKNEEK